MSESSVTTILRSEVLDKLLLLAVADPNPDIRLTVLHALQHPNLDEKLSEVENLGSLFVALNDEVHEVREVALSAIGRLSARNPAFVMPLLRKAVIQLLSELEFSEDVKAQEGSTRLLTVLLRSARDLMVPYADSIFTSFKRNLTLSATNPRDSRIVLSSLEGIGELSVVDPNAVKPHIDDLMPQILKLLTDHSSKKKRSIAVRVLGQVARSTGYVIDPYSRHPALLGILFELLKREKDKSLRHDTLQLIGILGAVDPLTQRTSLDSRTTFKNTNSIVSQADPTSLIHLYSASEDYFTDISITTLTRVISDLSLSTYHPACVRAVLEILRVCCVDDQKLRRYLGLLLPALLSTLQQSERGGSRLLPFLSDLVTVARREIEPSLQSLFGIVAMYWDSEVYPDVLLFVERVSLMAPDSFKIHIPDLIPLLLRSLAHLKNEKDGMAKRTLETVVIIGRSLGEYLHLVAPAIVAVFESSERSLEVRLQAMQTLGHLCRQLSFREYASRIVHPLSRLLQQREPEAKELKETALKILCYLMFQLGSDYAIFIPVVKRILVRHGIEHSEYENLVTRLLKQQPIREIDLPRLNFGTEIDHLHFDEAVKEKEESVPSKRRKVLRINEQALGKAWRAQKQSTKEDWSEWIRRLSLALIAESPEPALRFCLEVAQEYQPLVRDLFNASFIALWNKLTSAAQTELSAQLSTCLLSTTTPPEILQQLLNLAEYLEHGKATLPIPQSELAVLAETCHAFAKALHYKELEFREQGVRTAECIEALITLNNLLQQPQAAEGILHLADKHAIVLKESWTWFEKLHRWEDALGVYERREHDLKQEELAATQPRLKMQHYRAQLELRLGQLRCLNSLGEWDRLIELARYTWKSLDPDDALRPAVAPLAAQAAWNLQLWRQLEQFAEVVPAKTVQGCFYRALNALHQGEYERVRQLVQTTRELLDEELASLTIESYPRSYGTMVTLQQLSELEEVIEFKRTDNAALRQRLTLTWNRRLLGAQRSASTWQRLMAVRNLALAPRESPSMWLKYAALERKAGNLRRSHQLLSQLLGRDPMQQPLAPLLRVDAQAALSFVKQVWGAGVPVLALRYLVQLQHALLEQREAARDTLEVHRLDALLVRVCLRVGQWQFDLQEHRFTVESQRRILASFAQALAYNTSQAYKPWQAWAQINFELVEHVDERGGARPEELQQHVVAAVQGYFATLTFAAGARELRNVLRLLRLLFKYAQTKEVAAAFQHGFSTGSVDTWLQAIPQIIARLDAPSKGVRRLVHDLLVAVGREHPQALVYPLTVAAAQTLTREADADQYPSLPCPCPSDPLRTRKGAAQLIMEQMRRHSPRLMDEAQLVSKELIRVAVSWGEQWFLALEDASTRYFEQHSVEGMLGALAPLHATLRAGPSTVMERAFYEAYARDLAEAREACGRYEVSRDALHLQHAWALYYHVFKALATQVPALRRLRLQYASPLLEAARDLELAVPGTYEPGAPLVRIARFEAKLPIINSKRRPRKLAIVSASGRVHEFLLKGHEDLRQDERVMQLFGLVNTLLVASPSGAELDLYQGALAIKRYAVLPLSPTTGLIGWVPDCDTLNDLIAEFRGRVAVPPIPLLYELDRLRELAGGRYDALRPVHKVEVFTRACSTYDGRDLQHLMWLKAPTSEVWLDRRTAFTRSLAVMSMVGYVLGLGDRHPSNIMIERRSGSVVHIDFGDCFEVAMQREEAPERVPFRLTRMLIAAMEVSGIEGSFRATAEFVMGVLRDHRDALLAVLEAFVHDPLLNWRLVGAGRRASSATPPTTPATPTLGRPPLAPLSTTSGRRSSLRSSSSAWVEEGGAASGAQSNERALAVIARIDAKLTGRDGRPGSSLQVPQQVALIIARATAPENLAQGYYAGWMPFY